MSQAPSSGAPMIVMAICHYDDTNPSGGLEKQTRLLGQTLAVAGESVVVLGSTRRLSHAGWRTDGDVRVRLFWTYASPQVSGRYLPAALIWAFQLFIWVTLHHQRISVFHCQQIRIHAFVAVLARKLFGVPTILKSAAGGEAADVRAIGSHKYFGAIGRRFIIKNTDMFIATTESIREDLLEYGVDNTQIEIIPNGVALPGKDSASTAADDARARRCVFLGRLDEDKNVLALAAAAQKALNGPHAALDIYGDGADKAALQTQLAAHPANAVAYKGFIANPHDALPSYGWLILPSNAEGLSNAMIEAMLHGVVPVTTRVSGCVDHIDPGVTGFFLDGVDAPSIEAGFKRILATDPQQWQAMSRNVRTHALAHFDIQRVAAQYQTLYQRLQRTAQITLALQ